MLHRTAAAAYVTPAHLQAVSCKRAASIHAGCMSNAAGCTLSDNLTSSNSIWQLCPDTLLLSLGWWDDRPYGSKGQDKLCKSLACQYFVAWRPSRCLLQPKGYACACMRHISDTMLFTTVTVVCLLRSRQHLALMASCHVELLLASAELLTELQGK
jgi:hypothetical protein